MRDGGSWGELGVWDGGIVVFKKEGKEKERRKWRREGEEKETRKELTQGRGEGVRE